MAIVDFSPIPVEEESILEKYLDGRYIGIWKKYFDQNFGDLIILAKHYDEMTKQAIENYPPGYYLYMSNELEKIEAEILKAAELAGPYLNRKG